MTRQTLNKLAMPILLLLVLAIADSAWSSLREPSGLFRVVRGESVLANGLVDRSSVAAQKEAVEAGKHADPNTLLKVYPADVPFHLNFLEVGGRVWRGEINAAPSARAGEYRFTVISPKEMAPAEGARFFTLRVFPDQAAMRADSKSLFMRHLGLRPWILGLVMIPMAGLLLYLSFRVSRTEEMRLQAMGIGPIYKMVRHGEHLEVFMGLGSNHGVSQGDRLLLLNRGMTSVGEIVVEDIRTDVSIARVKPDMAIRLDYHVARHSPGGGRGRDALPK